MHGRQGHDPRLGLIVGRLERRGRRVPDRLRLPAGPDAEVILLPPALCLGDDSHSAGQQRRTGPPHLLPLTPLAMARQVTATVIHETKAKQTWDGMGSSGMPTNDFRGCSLNTSDNPRAYGHTSAGTSEVLLRIPIEAIADGLGLPAAAPFPLFSFSRHVAGIRTASITGAGWSLSVAAALPATPAAADLDLGRHHEHQAGESHASGKGMGRSSFLLGSMGSGAAAIVVPTNAIGHPHPIASRPLSPAPPSPGSEATAAGVHTIAIPPPTTIVSELRNGVPPYSTFAADGQQRSSSGGGGGGGAVAEAVPPLALAPLRFTPKGLAGRDGGATDAFAAFAVASEPTAALVAVGGAAADLFHANGAVGGRPRDGDGSNGAPLLRTYALRNSACITTDSEGGGADGSAPAAAVPLIASLRSLVKGAPAAAAVAQAAATVEGATPNSSTLAPLRPLSRGHIVREGAGDDGGSKNASDERIAAYLRGVAGERGVRLGPASVGPAGLSSASPSPAAANTSAVFGATVDPRSGTRKAASSIYRLQAADTSMADGSTCGGGVGGATTPQRHMHTASSAASPSYFMLSNSHSAGGGGATDSRMRRAVGRLERSLGAIASATDASLAEPLREWRQRQNASDTVRSAFVPRSALPSVDNPRPVVRGGGAQGSHGGGQQGGWAFDSRRAQSSGRQ